MAFWRWGMSKKRAYEWEHRVRLGRLLRREGELTSSDNAEGTFLLGEKRPIIGLQEKEKEEGLSTTDTDPISSVSNTRAMTSAKSSTSTDSMAIRPVTMSTDTSSRRRRSQFYLRSTDTPVARLPGISIYYTTAPTSHSHAPHTFGHFLEHFPALHSVCIFLHVRTAAQPHVRDEEKLMLEASPLWDGVWRGVYRVGYMETPDFSSADFVLALFEKLGRQVEGLTHVLQYTALQSRREKEARQVPWIKRIPEVIRGWFIDVLWSGVDEVIGGVSHGWKVPVGDVLSVGAVAEV